MYLVMEYLKEPWGEVLVREFSLQSLPVVAVNCHVYFSSPTEKKQCLFSVMMGASSIKQLSL